MNFMGEEKREFKRAFFTLEEGITAFVIPINNENKPAEVTILSISAGGLSFLGNRFKLPRMKPGDHLIINDIDTPQPIGKIIHTEVKIRYILDNPRRVRVVCGCEFVDIDENYIQQIEKRIESQCEKYGIERDSFLRHN